MAQSIEILENTFIKQGLDEIRVSLKEDTFNDLMVELNNNNKDDKCIVSIGNTNFIFSKK
jgi:hypothetical protein|tara:strand:+ start:2454 stop:2633 length:180 start_codon:yes stop_codon:yes gene_type:complete